MGVRTLQVKAAPFHVVAALGGAVLPLFEPSLNNYVTVF